MEKHVTTEHGELNTKSRKLLRIITILGVIALGVSAYLTYLHFAPEASEFCNLSDKFNCEIVNKSVYSYIDLGFVEVPVSLMGFGFYLFTLVVLCGLLKGWDFKKLHKSLTARCVVKIMAWLSVLGTLFSLYLTYIESFVLYTYCIFCLTSQVLVFLMTVLFFVTAKKMKK